MAPDSARRGEKTDNFLLRRLDMHQLNCELVESVKQAWKKKEFLL
jgi:hypothetical protein